ncbi:MAG: GntR family transcriptional regulator, partial [Porcipelethomonas sp.]
MITFNPEENGKTPLYQQLYNYIKKEIESGNIKSGEKLPSKRSLSAHIKVSIVTVEAAYAQLMAEGYIRSKPGSGFYVEENYFSSEPHKTCENIPPDDEILYDFRTNCVDTSDFPFSVWAKLSREVLSEKDSDLLNPCHPQGILFL